MPVTPNHPPKISVVIPFFNRVAWCLEALQSALQQTHPSLEILLVDDGSTEAITHHAQLQDPRVIYLRQENRGVAAARNLGLDHASGDFIAFLDSDDLWLPNKLEKQVAHMGSDPRYWMSHTSYLRIDPEGKRLGTINSGEFAGEVFPAILLGCPIATPTVMIRREVLEAGLRFREGLASSEDILFWSEVAQRSPILGLPEPLALVRLDGGNAALNPQVQIQGYRNILEFGIKGNPRLDLRQRKQLSSALYLRIASIAQEGGDLPFFLAAAVMAWLTPISPAGAQEAVAEKVADLLAQPKGIDQVWDQLSSDLDTSTRASGLEALAGLLRQPYLAHQQEAKQRALRSTGPLPPVIQNLPSPPLISVLVPTYNQADFLPETLDSLLQQTYPHWEALLVNDGSTDGTPEVIARYASLDHRFKPFHKPNGGVASALNMGIQQARGDWICWLSSDDLFQADKLAWHLEAIQREPDIRFFHANFLLLDDQKRSVYPPEPHPRGLVPQRELQTSEFLLRNYINGISIAVHASVFKEVGLFDERLRNGQDFDMWMRISSRYPSSFINKPTCLLRIHPSQGTSQFPAAGILDSGLACLRFLNQNPFEALFPLLNLDHPEDLDLALSTTLLHAANPYAFVAFSGFAPVLLSRLREWMTQKCPPHLRKDCFRNYNAVAQSVRAGAAADWIKRPFTPWSIQDRHAFRPASARKEMERQAEALRTSGNLQGAFDFARYLRRQASALDTL